MEGPRLYAFCDTELNIDKREFDVRLCQQADKTWLADRVARRVAGAKRGDVIVIQVVNWTYSYMFDGSRLINMRRLPSNFVPTTFLVPTEFPPNYWGLIEWTGNLLVPLDVAAHRRELLENLDYAMPPELTLDIRVRAPLDLFANLDHAMPLELILDKAQLPEASKLFYTAFSHGGVKYMLIVDFDQDSIRPPEDEVVRILDGLRELLCDVDVLYVQNITTNPFRCYDLWGQVTVAAGAKVLEFSRKFAEDRGVGVPEYPRMHSAEAQFE